MNDMEIKGPVPDLTSWKVALARDTAHAHRIRKRANSLLESLPHDADPNIRAAAELAREAAEAAVRSTNGNLIVLSYFAQLEERIEALELPG